MPKKAEETTPETTPAKRQHRASYSRDKRNGGYIIRIEGPNAMRFAGREVPVTRKDFTESLEQLEDMIWCGNDQDTGAPVALYHFVPRPRDTDEQDNLPF